MGDGSVPRILTQMRNLISSIHGLAGRYMTSDKVLKHRKYWHELRFWQRAMRTPNSPYITDYEFFYTSHFGLDKSFFREKRILDIGCGPRGSLVWAAEARVRVGMDPLALSYRRLGTRGQQMDYVAGFAETLPFLSQSFDVVCSFNSLDHVDDLDKAVGELIRILAPGGHFLLITEIHPHPTLLEPRAFSWDIAEKFADVLILVEEKHYEKTVSGIYRSIQAGVAFNHADRSERYGILSARFCKPA